MDHHRAAFAGQIEDLPVAELIRTTVHSGHSGVARFDTPRGMATLWFSEGQVVDAQMGRFNLENALRRLLDVESGAFEVEYKPITRRRLIARPTLDLLAEWERAQDDATHPPAGPRRRAGRKKGATWSPTGGVEVQRTLPLVHDTPRALSSTEMAELGPSEDVSKATTLPGIIASPPEFARTATEHSRLDQAATPAPEGSAVPGSLEDAASGIISVGVSWEAPTTALQPSSETIHSGQAPSARGIIDAEEAARKASADPKQTNTYLLRAAVRAPSQDERWRPGTDKPTASTPPTSPPSEPAASGPALVGRYEVLLRLARGGMGTVYLCRVTGQGGFRRLFALKVIRDHLSRNDEYVKMLLQEARIASRLHHPNAVSIVDIGVLENQHYLVMDYVEGCTFSELLKAHPRSRPPHLILPVVLDALAGLQAAHTLTDDDGRPLTLVHCDFSPQNMLIGTNGVCRITDFGVARAADALPEHTRKTRGKPGYLAPEQIRGRDFDHRADVFAAGVVLWNALTGEMLFSGETTDEILDQVLHREIPPPSEVGLRPPTWLDDICLQALERDPDRRYQSAEDMFMDLRNVAIEHGLLAAASEVGQWVTDSFGAQLQLRRQAAGLAPAAAPRPAVPVPELGIGRSVAEFAESDEVDGGPDESGSRTTVLHPDLPPDLPEEHDDEPVLALERRRRNAVWMSMAALSAAAITIAFVWPDMLRGGYVDEQGAYYEPIPDADLPEVPVAAPAPERPTRAATPANEEPEAPPLADPAKAEAEAEAESEASPTPLLEPDDEATPAPLDPVASAPKEKQARVRPSPRTKAPKKTARATPLPLPPPTDVAPTVAPEPEADDWEVKKIEAPAPLLPSLEDTRAPSAANAATEPPLLPDPAAL